MHDISANLHGMGDIDRHIAGQILRQNPLSSISLSKTILRLSKYPKTPKGPGASDTDSVTSHPGMYQASPIRVLSCAATATAPFGKRVAKTNGLPPLAFTSGSAKFLAIRAGAPWRTVAHQFLLPGLRWFEIQVDKHFLVNRYHSQPGRKRWSNTLPAKRPDNLVEALLGLSGSVEEEIGVYSGPHSGERVAHDPIVHPITAAT